MNPWQPTSMGITWHAHPLSSHSMHRLSHRSFFLSKASSMFSSHGTVSSTMMTRLTVSDHITISGRSWVCTMWCGKWGASFRSTAITQSLAAARNICPCGLLTCRGGASFLEETDAWFSVLGRLLVGHPTLGFSYLGQYGEHSVMATCVHLKWTPTGWKNMPQGPSCRLPHRAGVISCETPLLVVSRGGKEVIGGMKKEGQGEGFHSHQGRPWQFPGLRFLPVHPCAPHGLASSSGHSLLFLDHLEFCDDHVSTAPAVFVGEPSMQGTS